MIFSKYVIDKNVMDKPQQLVKELFKKLSKVYNGQSSKKSLKSDLAN